MASGLEIIFPVRTVFEMESANKAIQDMNSALSGKASNLKLDFGKVMPGESMVEKLGGYQQFFEAVRRGAQDVGKLTTDFTLMKNAMTGETVAVATKEMYTLKGATGETSTTFKDFSKEAQIKIEKLKALGYVLEATTKEEANVARAQKMGNDAIRDAEKATTAATNAAEKYLSKSKNMGGQQVQTARQAAQAVLDQAKAISTLDKSTQDYADGFAKMIQLQKDFGIALEGTKVGANAFQGWTTRIGNAIQQTIAYSFSIGLVYKAQQLLNDSVRYAIDLNKEMVKIQVLQAEGAQTPEEINALAKSFNDLGKEMGASTLEIARGSVEWFRQGRTVQETQELMRASMMLSKLGAMESADATNYLTSITNAFKIEVSDTASVVDKLIAVDNIAATSAGELATAMRYTSESAAIAGVEMEQLISYIGTVSTVTRQNAEMIGQAFKTMFARMTQIQGGGTDEEGWTISKVEAALAKVNIEVKNADDSFRNMGDVLEETAAIWGTLTDREQVEIATAIAGVRQKEAFLVLMDNMDKALTYQAAQTDATGLAMNRYGIYLEGVEAKQAKLTAAMQELYASVVNSKMVGTFYDIATGIVEVITQGKLLIPILTTILILLIEINRTQITAAFTRWSNIIKADWTPAIKSVIGFLKNLGFNLIGIIKDIQLGKWTAFKMVLVQLGQQIGITATSLAALKAALITLSPYLLAFAPLAIATAGWYIHKQQVEKATESVKEYINAQKELRQSNEDARKSMTIINELLDKRARKKDWDAESAQQLANEFERLQEILPELDWKWMDGRPFLEQKIDLQDFNDTLEKSVEITEKQSHALYIYTQENIRNYAITKKRYEEELELQRILGEAQKRFEAAGGKEAGEKAAIDYISGLEERMNQFPVATKNAIAAANRIIESYELNLPGTNNFEERLSEALNKAAGAVEKDKGVIASFQQMFSELISSGLDPVTGVMNEWLSTLVNDTWLGKIKVFRDLIQDLQTDIVNNQEWSRDSWDRLNDAGEKVNDTFERMEKTLETTFLDSVDNIKDVSDSVKNLGEETDDIGRANALRGLTDTIDELNKKGAELPTKSLKDFIDENGRIDPTKVKEYAIEIIKLIAGNEELIKQAPELLAALQTIATGEINAIRQVANTVINVTGQAGEALTVMTSAQFAEFSQMISETMWQQAQSAGVTLKALDGQVIQSSAQVAQALAKNSANYAVFIRQITASTNSMLASTLSYFKAASAFILGGKKGYTPVQPSFGGTGGGSGGTEEKKEDPRIKAIEKKIRGYEEEIWNLEEIIEDLEDQKIPLEDLIELEEEKIEAINREIEIYQERIEDLDREIELLERQKDAYDELIDAQEALKEPLEQQKDDLDEKLDAFEEYIDLQKESLERIKDEADFIEELEKKQKKLNATKAELALAGLDTSEEGQKRRLELEQQLAEDEEDLTEFTEERKYELQVRALDDALKAFEDNINAQKALIDDQIKLIDDEIERYEGLKKSIDDLIEPLEKEKLALEDLIYPLEEQIEDLELIVRGYEDQKKAIEDLIEPYQRRIDILNDFIEDLNHEKKLIQEINDELSGSGGGGGGTAGAWGAVDVAQEKVGATFREILAMMHEKLGENHEDLGISEQAIQRMSRAWENQGLSIDEATAALDRYLEKRRKIEEAGLEYGQTGLPGPGGKTVKSNQKEGLDYGGGGSSSSKALHEGGFATGHGDDRYTGILKESEVFAKLLKGEYVATEDQMKMFLKKTLPSIAIEASKLFSDEEKSLKARARARIDLDQVTKPKGITPPSKEPTTVNISIPQTSSGAQIVKPITYNTRDYENAGGNISIEMNINVQGSLDKTVLPELRKSIVKDINKSLEKRGYRRTADNFAL